MDEAFTLTNTTYPHLSPATMLEFRDVNRRPFDAHTLMARTGSATSWASFVGCRLVAIIQVLLLANRKYCLWQVSHSSY